MSEPVITAGEDIFLKGASLPFEPLKQARASGLKKLELHWTASLLLDNDCSLTDAGSTH